VLDGAVEVEAAEATVAAATAVDDADADAKPCPVEVAVDPVVRVAVLVGAGVGVPGAFSLCARFVALPKPRNLPIIPPPGVPGVATPFPHCPLPFPAAVVPPLLPVPAFAPETELEPVPEPLSSGVAGAGAGAAPPLDTDGRRVGAETSSFGVVTVVLAVVAPPLEDPWTACED
jgi:hypothetical protein